MLPFLFDWYKKSYIFSNIFDVDTFSGLLKTRLKSENIALPNFQTLSQKLNILFKQNDWVIIEYLSNCKLQCLQTATPKFSLVHRYQHELDKYHNVLARALEESFYQTITPEKKTEQIKLFIYMYYLRSALIQLTKESINSGIISPVKIKKQLLQYHHDLLLKLDFSTFQSTQRTQFFYTLYNQHFHQHDTRIKNLLECNRKLLQTVQKQIDNSINRTSSF